LSILNAIRLKDSIRLIGVTLSHLKRDDNDQMALFDYRAKEKSILNAVDSINDKYGDFTITWASYLEQAEPPGVISPAWKPSGVRNVNVRN
jgi:DNA polymerase-4